MRREKAGSSTDSPRSVICCEICGEASREPLVLFMSPTRTIRHRKPQEYTACEKCRVAEFVRNRQAIKEEDEELRKEYALEMERRKERAAV